MTLPAEPGPSEPRPLYRFHLVSITKPSQRHWWEIVDTRTTWTAFRSMEFITEKEARDNAKLFAILMALPVKMVDGWSQQFPSMRSPGAS